MPEVPYFHVDPARYPVFGKQGCMSPDDGRLFTVGVDESLSAFISDTAGVIAELDGSSEAYSGDPRVRRPDHAIFLDKSARPVAWAVCLFWDVFAVPGAARPPISYLSIDRRPWIEMSGAELFSSDYVRRADGSVHHLAFEDFAKENIGAEHFAWIRSQYIPGGIAQEDAEDVLATPCPLDGASICVVDEVASTGTTLKIACWLVERAFPGAIARGIHFWRKLAGQRSVGGDVQMLSAPLWYDNLNPYGRGCGERDADGSFYRARYERNPNAKTRAQAFGARVRSTFVDLGPDGPDARGTDRPSRRLAAEMRQAKEDYLAGRILFQPPANYGRQRKREAIEAQGLRVTREQVPDSFIAACEALRRGRG